MHVCSATLLLAVLVWGQRLMSIAVLVHVYPWLLEDADGGIVTNYLIQGNYQ